MIDPVHTAFLIGLALKEGSDTVSVPVPPNGDYTIKMEAVGPEGEDATDVVLTVAKMVPLNRAND